MIIHGTTHSTANITSVRMSATPVNTGCASFLIVVGALTTIGWFVSAAGIGGEDAASPLIMGLVLLGVGIVWFKSKHAVYHLMLATAAGERQGLSSHNRTMLIVQRPLWRTR